MDRHTSRVARRLSPLLVGILLLTVLAPAGARAASTDLALGGQATVSGAEGGFALLRAEPGWDAMVLTSVPEGTVVEVLDGPLTTDDGSLWYGVIALDQQGVLPATLLTPGVGTSEEAGAADAEGESATEGETAADGETPPPVPTGEIATIAGTSDEGARCRTEPTYEADVIIVLYEGDAVELTGPASEEWQPLICAGAQGYVHNDFVLLEGESTLEQAPVEDVPAEEAPAADVPVEDGPAEELPVTEDPAAVGPDDEEPTDEIPAEALPIVDEPIVNTPTEDVPVDDVPAAEVPNEEDPVFEAPAVEIPAEEPQVTVPAATDDGETPVDEPTEEPTGVPTDVAAELPTEVVQSPVAVDVPAEIETPVVTEEPAEDATEVPAEAVVPIPVPTVAVPEIGADAAASIQQTFAAAVDTSDAGATGYAVVTGTNGDGVRCRVEGNTSSATITVLLDGAEVALRGNASGSWQPVVCAKSNGFVHTDYLSASDGSGDITAAVGSDGDFSAASVTGSAVVSGTGGGGLRCRSSAGYSGSIITVLAEGSKVNLNGSAQGEWQPVICAGKNGFAHVDYLTKSAGSSPSDTSSASTGGTGSAKVTGTNGDGLRCRSAAGYDGSIITVLAEGASVSLRGNAQGEWQPVTCAGRNGFVHVDYISTSSSGGGTSGGSTSGGSSGSATVTGTGGGGLNCRTSPNGSVLMVLSEGATVTLRGAAEGNWQPVVCGGKDGYVHTDYITKSGGGGGSTSGGSTSGGSSDDGSTAGRFAVGSHVATTANLNLRYEPSMSSGVAAVAPSGTVVKVTGNRVGFVAVDWDGLKGWMHSDYLTSTNAGLSQRGGSGTPSTPPPTPSDPAQSGGGSGGAIVDFAMNYVGYPYVWAGEGPYGFDCSGFVMFVVKNVLGLSITHDMFVQYDLGTPVSRDALQPGDIVFFQNTFRWGMSHNGIYIGNGQFVHAENETTGVRVSDINSQYYSSRYYGAVRFT